MNKELRQYVKGWLQVVIGWLDKERKPAPEIPHLWRDYLGPIMFCIGLALAIPALIILGADAHHTLSKHDAEALQPSQSEASQISWPCPKAADLRTSDLCAQWKAADAARDGAVWTFWSFVVSVITLIAVAFGFWQSVSVRKQEYRAYIRPECRNVHLFDNRYVTDLYLENYGRTPAQNIKIVNSFAVLTSDVPPVTIFKDTRIYNRDFVHPGNAVDCIPNLILNIPEDIFKHVTAHKFAFIVAGHIKYSDIFGGIHSEKYSRIFLGEPKDEKYAIAPIEF